MADEREGEGRVSERSFSSQSSPVDVGTSFTDRNNRSGTPGGLVTLSDKKGPMRENYENGDGRLKKLCNDSKHESPHHR